MNRALMLLPIIRAGFSRRPAAGTGRALEGWAYLAVLLNVCTRRVVGWALFAEVITGLQKLATWPKVWPA